MSVLLLVKGLDSPVPPSPGRWLGGEVVAVTEVSANLSFREANPPQDGGGFFQVVVGDRDPDSQDILEYLLPYMQDNGTDEPTMLKRRVLQLSPSARVQLVSGTGRANWAFATLQSATVSAADS